MTPSTFDPRRVLDVLTSHQVQFVVIGGTAAVLHGAAYVTEAIDVCPATDRENLDRLSNALDELDARIRVDGVPEGFEFSYNGESLGRASIWNLQTNAGMLDLAIAPAGVDGHRELSSHAEEFDVGGLRVMVASLDDIIRSTRAADRPKDHQALPMLEAMRDRRDRS